MIKKPYAFAVVLLITGVLFSACVLEYDFDSAPPWRNAQGYTVDAFDATGTARGWGGDVTVTFDLISGIIMNVRINAPGETPSFTRDLIQNAPERIEIFNSFEFLSALSGATRTAEAIRSAGETALTNVLVVLE